MPAPSVGLELSIILLKSGGLLMFAFTPAVIWAMRFSSETNKALSAIYQKTISVGIYIYVGPTNMSETINKTREIHAIEQE